jgi:aldose 1-epimerase
VAGVEIAPWGLLEDGRTVRLATLRNARGFEVRVSDFGATIVGVRAPDRDGRLDEVVLGFSDLADYRSEAYRAAGPYFGATVGRYANRIGGARFTLDGRDYRLTANEGGNQLHGGPRGFDQAVWTMEPLASEIGLRLSLVSPDGDQGFPGRLDVTVEMALADHADTLVLRYRAVTDHPTHVNLTSHPYFNLDLEGAATILDHRLAVFAEAFTPADAASVPTGDIAPVAGGPLDLRAPRRLREVLDHPDLAASRGLNHNYVLRRGVAKAPRRAARLCEPRTGRSLEIRTTEPGLQVYSAGYLPDLVGRAGERFGPESGIALEAQHFPDSPNHPAFPTTRLNPEEVFVSETQLRFGVDG